MEQNKTQIHFLTQVILNLGGEGEESKNTQKYLHEQTWAKHSHVLADPEEKHFLYGKYF